ncbi:MAG TPA: hypothetical protein VGJ69_09160, partial [Pyrinomonadaceae bacterium]
MNRKSPFVLLLALVMCCSAVAQKRRARSAARTTSKQAAPTKPDEAAAQPAPTPAPAPTSNSPTLAIVNDTSFTASDIEPVVSETILNDPDLYLHDFYQDREKAIREARQRAVDARISSMLITAEAKKRNMTTDAFLDAEVNGKIA